MEDTDQRYDTCWSVSGTENRMTGIFLSSHCRVATHPAADYGVWERTTCHGPSDMKMANSANLGCI